MLLDLSCPTMSLLLNEHDKLVILTVAGMLVIVTFLITTCLVIPWCYMHRVFVKPRTTKKEEFLNLIYPPFANAESQNFHLSVVPVYGAQQEKSLNDSHNITHLPQQSPSTSPFHQRLTNSFNQYENLTQLAEKARMRFTSPIKSLSDCNEDLSVFPKIFALVQYESVTESSIKLQINIGQVFDLQMKKYPIEPSCYISVILIGSRRKSIINKASQSEIFRTETVKKSLNPVFTNCKFVSEELPKCLLKEGSLKFRVIDDERYANDVCLGEITIPLKKIDSIETSKAQQMDTSNLAGPLQHEVCTDTAVNDNALPPPQPQQAYDQCTLDIGEQQSAQLNMYSLFPIKEVKGELLVGFCYLPTSKRINIAVAKGNLRQSLLNLSNGTSIHQAFYSRVLMFNNGKLIKKKKTVSNVRLLWGENETLSFDLPEEPYNNLSFMVILSYKLQNTTSPVSPESPDTPEAVETGATNALSPDDAANGEESLSRKNSSSSLRKNSCIGHFVLDRETWLEEILKRPRKQVIKWYKLS